ncbi:phosphatase PAP2 family protein [Legionella maioricensis]|uniref:Phosphatase PAP2 family protein n=1 Tax=Legionella maioricensis TaxID=2896528 RepID=A0A9X2I9T7_9GAMM|nr:phosphatase PAP2 family protein [Legionella maioricensis]MCL9683524.1 phosphatase PAP2 family protein [Legionella maioricensis]MCL9686823.1 phosphatase PAP2 family protein [Legionella maioricensis]
MFDGIKKILTSFQLETYLLYILPITGLLFISLFENPPFSILSGISKETFAWSFFYGGQLIKIGFLFFYIYIYFKIALWLSQWVSVNMFNGQQPPNIRLKPFFLSFSYIMFAIGFGNFFMVISIQHLSQAASRESVIAASQLFMSMDRYIFGFDPQLWIQRFSNSSILDYLFIQSYVRLYLFFITVFIGLILFKIDYFRQFLVAIFIAPFIAMPFWFAFPAVTPNEMYRNNLYSLPSVLATQQEYEKTNKSTTLIAYLHGLEKSVENSTRKHPLVTTNPSMHVTWGTIIVYFAIRLWWPLGFIFIPWLVLNILSTLYTFQHYAVDLPAGIVCGVLSIIITKSLFKFEKKYYTGNYRLLYFVKALQSDMQSLISKWSHWCLKGKHFFSRTH